MVDCVPDVGVDEALANIKSHWLISFEFLLFLSENTELNRTDGTLVHQNPVSLVKYSVCEIVVQNMKRQLVLTG